MPPKIVIRSPRVTGSPTNSQFVYAARPGNHPSLLGTSDASGSTNLESSSDVGGFSFLPPTMAPVDGASGDEIPRKSVDEVFKDCQTEFIHYLKIQDHARWANIQPLIDIGYRQKFSQLPYTFTPAELESLLDRFREAACHNICMVYLDNFTANNPHLDVGTPAWLQIQAELTALGAWPCIFRHVKYLVIHQIGPIIEDIVEESHWCSTEQGIEIARHLLPLLRAERFYTKYYWLDIGRLLYNITSGSTDGLDLWIKYSGPAVHHMCRSLYPNIGSTPLTVKTLAWYTQCDNRVAYDEWHRAWCHEALTTALSCLHADVAKAVYRVFWLEYICPNSEKNLWYKFNGTRFERLDNAMDLRKDITSKFISIYEGMRAEASLKIFTELQGRDAQKKELEAFIAQIGGLIRKLKSEGYKSVLIKAAHEFFHIKSFTQISDSDPNKTGWNNCVVEICDGVAYPRPGKPEDFITMTTGISYRNDLYWDHPVVKKLMLWLGKAFVDPELLKYFKKDVASFLYGRNSEKYFRVWTGDTDNSKSMIVKLLECSLGDYIFNIPVSVFTAKPFSSSGPNPEIAQGKSCHVGVISEPDTDEDFRNGVIKRMSGGDSYFARKLNEDGGKIISTYKPILQCNRIPNIPNVDRATMNRWFILPFLSTWTENPPATEEARYQRRLFLKDPKFEAQIPELAVAFGWLMVQSYPSYAQEGLIRPKIVQDYIDRHWESRDPYLAFIKERIAYAYKEDKTTLNLEASLSSHQIYPSFVQWYRDQHLGNIIPPKHRFHDEMCSKGRLGALNAENRWLGIILTVQPLLMGGDPLSRSDLSSTNLASHNAYHIFTERRELNDDTQSQASCQTTASQAIAAPDVDEWVSERLVVECDYKDNEFMYIDELFIDFSSWWNKKHNDLACPITVSSRLGVLLKKKFPDEHRERKKRGSKRAAAIMGLSTKND